MLTFLCIILAMTAGVVLMNGHPLIALLGLVMSTIFVLAQEVEKEK